MKSIKNYLILLLAVSTFMFSACEDSGEYVEPTIPNTINTFAPSIEGDRVTFRGRLLQPENAKEYGFMWYERNSNGNGEIKRVVVGTGNLNGEFTEIMTNLPKGAELTVCAFVTYEFETDNPIENIGEEVDFVYD